MAKREQMIFLRLPREPRKLAVMFNSLAGKHLVSKVEFNDNIASLFTVAPIFGLNASTIYVKQLDMIVNKSLYTQEIDKPSLVVRQQAANIFIEYVCYYGNFGIGKGIKTIFKAAVADLFVAPFVGVALHATLGKLQSVTTNQTVTSTIKSIYTIIGVLVFCTLLLRFRKTTAVSKKCISKTTLKAQERQFVTQVFDVNNMILEEDARIGYVLSKLKAIVHATSDAIIKRDFTKTEKLLLALLAIAIPVGTYAYVKNSEVIKESVAKLQKALGHNE